MSLQIELLNDLHNLQFSQRRILQSFSFQLQIEQNVNIRFESRIFSRASSLPLNISPKAPLPSFLMILNRDSSIS